MSHARSQSFLGSPVSDNRQQIENEPGNFDNQFWSDIGIEELPDNVTRPHTPSSQEPALGVSLFGGGPLTTTSDTTQIATHPSEGRQQAIGSSQLEDIVEELSLSPNVVRSDDATNKIRRGSSTGLTPQPSQPTPTNLTLDPTLGTQIISSSAGYLGSAEDNTQTPTDPSGSSSSSSSPSPSPERQQIKYSLRESARNGSHVVRTTWYDRDDSGTFDPNAERRRKQQPKKRATLHQVSGNDLDDDDDDDQDDGVPRQPKVSSLLNARQSGQCCIVTLNLGFEKGRELLSQHSDNWPEEHLNILNDEHIWKDIDQRQEEVGSFGPVLRPRKRYVRYDCPSEEEPRLPAIPDPKGEHEDLRGHPSARGCIRCRINGEECTMRKTGNTWPCVQCIDAFGGEKYVDCELIIPPAKKQACEGCQDRMEDCSYTQNEDDHDIPCEQCLGEGMKCIAGPAREAYPYRATYTPPPEAEYIPFRPYVTCTACRQVKKSCSLKSKTDQPPCKACKKAKIPCTFEKIIPTNPGKRRIDEVVSGQVEDEEDQQQQPFEQDEPEGVKSPRKRRSLVEAPSTNTPSSTDTNTNKDSSLTNTSTPAFSSVNKPPPPKPRSEVLTDADGHRGPLTVILTSMAHPIRFMQPLGNCNWCSNIMFSLFGLEWKQPTVIAWYDGLGYTELHDGHRELGLKATVMCTECTMDRVGILSCPGHRMRALRPPYLTPEQVEEELSAALSRLFESALLPTDRWCNVCQSPAIVECCTEQDADKWGDPIQPGSPEAVGCGLCLCETCEGRLGALGGDLQAVLQEKLADDAGVREARADAGFLLYDGLLMKNVLAQANS
ncbi:uncharacterized protein K452DRAFT_357617 [Aplosporella prunicola CBS 121167]|uniref:Zn(2)-C6 fungal-type domain-containing protein n=1 Tax=Aplosporella prunicola CBS 121167 TaxID=1176127 RepID=A0A6A6BGG7_9PEZI|nr:uncharacterized protein K452DRAFT_357617 [Aplosporella prunicola CBS 121167]KAF2143262.1 hypothetical protein K452DRAFT_357617 [Aplosporella prunicola CBS 121167]